MNTPTPELIKQVRREAGLTATQAAALVHRSVRAWNQYEQGVRAMDAAAWELFNIKIQRSGVEFNDFQQ